MKTNHLSFAELPNDAVIAEVARLAATERQATARLVAALAEFDARRLYLGEGCSSLFTYCTHVLHLSEHAAYSRIEAARAGRRFPLILELLLTGDLNVTAVGLLARFLTDENHGDVLRQAVHKSKRDIEELVVRLRPQPDAPSSVRKLPAAAVAAAMVAAAPTAERTLAPAQPSSVPGTAEERPIEPPGPGPQAVMAPLAPQRYRIQFTVGRETYDNFRRVQDLMRHSVPNGDPAVVFGRALSVLLAELEKQKCAATTQPRGDRRSAGGSRHIPAAVRRNVWKRDEGQCAFKGARGRCRERGFLEFHHVQPFAVGGAAEEANIELRCAAHNQYEADLFFGSGDPLLARERVSVSYGVNSVRTELSASSSPKPSTRFACAPA